MFRFDISAKRSLSAILLPYSSFLDRTNWTSRWCRTVARSECAKFNSREEMYRYVQDEIVGSDAIDYLEFGVADGNSMRAWCAVNHHPESRFHGFDCFTGLPEDWTKARPRGTFNRNGVPPNINDGRVQFHVGLFQASVPMFLNSYRPTNRVVIHNDCDLYSSTLYALTMLDGFIGPDSVVIFDEFWDALHEYRALVDYCSAYSRTYDIIAATQRFAQVAIIFGSGAAGKAG